MKTFYNWLTMKYEYFDIETFDFPLKVETFLKQIIFGDNYSVLMIVVGKGRSVLKCTLET